MAARATRSASRKARLTEAVATGPFGALSHDELGVIFDGLADPLEPVVAVALSSTCLGLRTPLRAALEVLKERHARATALCRKVETSRAWLRDAEGTSCAELRDAEQLFWFNKGLTADDMATLGMILRTNGLPRLWRLSIYGNGFGDPGMQALCEGLGLGAAPSLRILNLSNNQIGPAGAEPLAAALGRGAMPKLENLLIHCNPSIGSQGMAALAAPLRKLPALRSMHLDNCEISDEGVVLLVVANLGKDDFKKLEYLFLQQNKIGDVGAAKLVAALDAGGLPKLINCDLSGNPASGRAVQAVKDALVKRLQ